MKRLFLFLTLSLSAPAKITLVNVVSVTASVTTIAANARTIMHKTKVGVKAVKRGAVKVGKAVNGK